MLRTLSVYRTAIERLGSFRIVSPIGTIPLAGRIGFDGMPNEGDSIVPLAIGPATSFNANGRVVVRSDLPKETQSRMIWTSWNDWHGQRHDGMQIRDYEVYPREIIAPPGEQLVVLRRGDQLVAASREMSAETPEVEVVNVLNVFLEIFGEIENTPPGLMAPPDLRVRQLKWRILPPGHFPFERAMDSLEKYIEGLPEADQRVAVERIREITRFRPDFLAVGLGGFSDYVVFGFAERRRYILESPHLGNATYIFRDDWERLAALTKQEILVGNLQENRLIHNHRWAQALREAVNAR
jgi:hypothetical protein